MSLYYVIDVVCKSVKKDRVDCEEYVTPHLVMTLDMSMIIADAGMVV